MKLTVTTFTTLDGVMQAPGAVDEDPSNGFRRGGWLPPFFDEDMGRIISRIFEQADAILLGRTTYDMMQRFWSQVSDPSNVVAHALNTLPKHVATSRPETLTWNQSRAIEGALIQAVRGLKSGAGRELQVHGSHQLVQGLLGAGLVDELSLWTFPVVVGKGKRLFETNDMAASFRLVASEVTGAGVIVARYVPVGTVGQHSFVVTEGTVGTDSAGKGA